MLGHVSRLLNSWLNDRSITLNYYYKKEKNNMFNAMIESLVIFKILWDIAWDIGKLIGKAVVSIMTFIVNLIREQMNNTGK